MKAENIQIIHEEGWYGGKEEIPLNLGKEGLRNTDTIITVAGTCTHFAMQKIMTLLGAASIVFYDSFEECREAHRQSRGGVTLPLASPMADNTYIDWFSENFGTYMQPGGPGMSNYCEHRRFYGIQFGTGVGASAVIQNPPIYFAKRTGKDDIKSIACLPELQHFLGEIPDNETLTIIQADSNIDAARMVQSGKVDACITNQSGVDETGLEIVKRTGYDYMKFIFQVRGIEYFDESWGKFKQIYHGLKYMPFPLSNMHYQIFVERGWNQEENWSADGLKWKQQHPERNYPTYWHTHEGVEGLKPVTGITFWEAEACAKYFGMRLPTVDEFQTLAFNAQNNLPIHSPGFVSDTSTRKNIDTVHPLIGNVAKWCIGSNGIPVLCGGSSWDYDARWDTTLIMPPGNCDNNTGIFLVSGSLNTPDIRTQKEESADISRNISRPTAPFRQEGNESSVNARTEKGKFTISVGKEKYAFDISSLKKLPQYEQTGTFQCVCNWAEECKVRGVLLSDILKEIDWNGDPKTTYLFCESYPGKDGKTYTTCERLDRLLRTDAPTMLITSLQTSHDSKLMELSDELGGPIRIWSNGVNGYKQVKALKSMRLQDTFQAGEWESKAGYPEDGTPQAGTRTIIGTASRRIHSLGGIIGTTETRGVE